MLVIALLCAFVVPSLSAECHAQIGSTYCTNFEGGFGGIWGGGGSCTNGIMVSLTTRWAELNQ